MSRKSFLSHLHIILTSILMMACQSDEIYAMPPAGINNTTDGDTKTLIVYYSYTHHTEQIVADLRTLINADVIEVEPTDKTLKYEANNYAIGTEQLNKIKDNPNSESSYPAIDPVTVDMNKYNTIIIATPLWWSQMRAICRRSSSSTRQRWQARTSALSCQVPAAVFQGSRQMPSDSFPMASS